MYIFNIQIFFLFQASLHLWSLLHITSTEEHSLASCRIIYKQLWTLEQTLSRSTHSHLRLCMALFLYYSIWKLREFTNFALLWLILNFSSDMASRIQLHPSGGTWGRREFLRLLGCLSVTADILRKETLPQRGTEMGQFYQEFTACILPCGRHHAKCFEYLD